MNGRTVQVERRARSEHGQALTEFIVLALALIPLFLLIPVVAKYQDIAHATQMASRYIAFDAMTRNSGSSSWKPRSQLEDEVRRRFFGNSDAPIKTDDSAGDFKANQNPFWSDQQGNPLIKSFNSDVRINFGPSGGVDQSSAFSPASDSAAFELAPGILDGLGLQHKGIYTASISVTLANLPSATEEYTKSYEQFKSIGLVMTRHTSLLIDYWSAKDAEQTESRIDQFTLFPGKILAKSQPALDVAVSLVESPSCFHGGCTHGPKVGKLDFWRDVVPADRMK